MLSNCVPANLCLTIAVLIWALTVMLIKLKTVKVRARNTVISSMRLKFLAGGFLAPRAWVLLAALVAIGLYANSRSWHAHDSALSPSDRARLGACVPKLLAQSAPPLSGQPKQSAKPSCEPFQINDYTITPLADFVIQARVLGSERYRFDGGAKLAPLDLALGWGRMADSQVLNGIQISQSGRFFFWGAPTFPIPREEIEQHAANMHMLPANPSALRELGRARPDDYVRLWGFLVRISKPDGYLWQSSTTRSDTGRGACEVIWVERVQISQVPIGA